MYLIVGLGNPGREYENTRHNIGFMVADELVRRHSSLNEKVEQKAITVKVRIDGEDCLIAKPQTYMNLSGESVLGLMNYYKIPEDKLLVMHDDIDLAFAQIKLQIKRGHGGQNGIRSIHQLLGHNNYMRAKLGVGRPSHPGQDVSSWVLGKFKADEHAELEELIDRSCKAVESFVLEGPKQAMETYNQNPKKGKN